MEVVVEILVLPPHVRRRRSRGDAQQFGGLGRVMAGTAGAGGRGRRRTIGRRGAGLGLEVAGPERLRRRRLLLDFD
jgi:hypothetical protein